MMHGDGTKLAHILLSYVHEVAKRSMGGNSELAVSVAFSLGLCLCGYPDTRERAVNILSDVTGKYSMLLVESHPKSLRAKQVLDYISTMDREAAFVVVAYIKKIQEMLESQAKT